MSRPHFTTVAQAYEREREPVILRLDVAAARVLASKYHLPMPDDDRRILQGLHRARLKLAKCPDDLRDESRTWLEEKVNAHS